MGNGSIAMKAILTLEWNGRIDDAELIGGQKASYELDRKRSPVRLHSYYFIARASESASPNSVPG